MSRRRQFAHTSAAAEQRARNDEYVDDNDVNDSEVKALSATFSFADLANSHDGGGQRNRRTFAAAADQQTSIATTHTDDEESVDAAAVIARIGERHNRILSSPVVAPAAEMSESDIAILELEALEKAHDEELDVDVGAAQILTPEHRPQSATAAVGGLASFSPAAAPQRYNFSSDRNSPRLLLPIADNNARILSVDPTVLPTSDAPYPDASPTHELRSLEREVRHQLESMQLFHRKLQDAIHNKRSGALSSPTSPQIAHTHAATAEIQPIVRPSMRLSARRLSNSTPASPNIAPAILKTQLPTLQPLAPQQPKQSSYHPAAAVKSLPTAASQLLQRLSSLDAPSQRRCTAPPPAVSRGNNGELKTERTLPPHSEVAFVISSRRSSTQLKSNRRTYQPGLPHTTSDELNKLHLRSQSAAAADLNTPTPIKLPALSHDSASANASPVISRSRRATATAADKVDRRKSPSGFDDDLHGFGFEDAKSLKHQHDAPIIHSSDSHGRAATRADIIRSTRRRQRNTMDEIRENDEAKSQH